MTLTLEQVRQTRFHLARRNGYEPVDVDNFVDKVEATLSQLTEENDTLKQQLETVSSTEPSGIFVPGPGEDQEKESLRQELEHSQATVAELRASLESREAEANDLRSALDARDAQAAEQPAETGEDQGNAELDALRHELEGLRTELANRDAELHRLRGELEGAHGELDSVRGELAGRDQELAAARADLENAQTATQVQPVVSDVPTGQVENIVVTAAPEASQAVTKLLQMATEQSERLVGEAQVEASRLVQEAQNTAQQTIDEANRKAHEAMTDARTRAERIESEARVNAEKLTSDADARAQAVNGEADARRNELFSALESERDTLRGKVDHLKAFEGRYRENLTRHLQSQIDVLGEANLTPDDEPALLGEPANQSATPRLDALLNEQG